jgi:hypothetical protein
MYQLTWDELRKQLHFSKPSIWEKLQLKRLDLAYAMRLEIDRS